MNRLIVAVFITAILYVSSSTWPGGQPVYKEIHELEPPEFRIARAAVIIQIASLGVRTSPPELVRWSELSPELPFDSILTQLVALPKPVACSPTTIGGTPVLNCGAPRHLAEQLAKCARLKALFLGALREDSPGYLPSSLVMIRSSFDEQLLTVAEFERLFDDYDLGGGSIFVDELDDLSLSAGVVLQLRVGR